MELEFKKTNTFDEADNIIFRVYDGEGIKETYEELCNMPFEAFCKLYERVVAREAFRTEAENEHEAAQKAMKRGR